LGLATRITLLETSPLPDASRVNVIGIWEELS